MFRVVLSPEEYRLLCKVVLERDEWKCRYCKVRTQLQVHHIIFRSDGGDDASYNLCTLCGQCHDAMHRGDLVLIEVDAQKFPFNADYELYFRALNGWRPE